MTKTILKAALGLVLMGSLYGSQAEAATPKDQLIMGWNIDSISSFDPAEINEIVPIEMLRNICQPLAMLSPDDESKVVPAIAESWTVSDDKRVITFKLRKGVKFASGNPVTAKDVAWSIKRVLSLGRSGATALTDFGFNTKNMDEAFKALDDETFQVTLQGAYPVELILKAVIAERAGMVLDSAFLADKVAGDDQANTYLKTHTACSGPYTLRQWVAGETVVLERNDNYWGKAPAMRRIIIRHIPEASTQRLLIEKGDIDIARTVVSADIPEYKNSQDLHLKSFLRPTLQYIAFNTAKAPFNDPRVIDAFRYMFDYEGLTKTAMANLGEPRQVLVQAGAFGALPKDEGAPYTLNLDKARSLLTEAGVAPGLTLSLAIANDPISSILAQHLANNASKLGITVNIEQMATTELFSRFRGRNFTAVMTNWSALIPDAHGMVSRFALNPGNAVDSGFSGYPTWRTSWSDDGINKLAIAALSETDPNKRQEMYYQLQRDDMKESPFIFLFQLMENMAVRNQVTSIPAHAFGVYYDGITK